MFDLYNPHAALIPFFPLAYLVILILAACFRSAFPGISLGYWSMVIWAWVLLSSYFSDFVNAPSLGWIFLTFMPLLFSAGYAAYRSRGGARLREITPLRELFTCFTSWLLGILVLLTPLLFFVPLDTIITGRHYCNDVVGHALVAKGAQHFLDTGINMQLFHWYPRAFHTVLYYITQVTGYSPSQIILPFLLFCYSFIVPFSWDVAKSFAVRSALSTFALSVIICAPFLSLTVLYQEFAAQSAVIPLVLLVLFRFFVSMNEKLSTIFLMQCFLISAAFSTYTIFPISIFGLGVLIKASLFPRRTLEFMSHIPRLLNKKTGALFAGIFLLSIPGLTAMFLFLNHQANGDKEATDILHSSGNLQGYLSPMHFSGFWPPNVDHRLRPGSASSWIDYPQLLVIAVYLFFLFRAKLGKAYIGALATVAFPVLVIPFLGVTEYIQFKYYSLLIPSFFLAVGISLHTVAPERIKSLAVLFFALFLFGTGTFYSGRVIGLWPTLSLSDYQKYMSYRAKFFAPGDALLLTQDDWFRYFADRKSVYVPLVGLNGTPYSGQPLKRIIIDKASPAGNAAYLQTLPKLEAVTGDVRCREFSDDRIDVYRYPCHP